MSPGKQMPLSEALADLQTRKRALSRSFACVAGGLLVNEPGKANASFRGACWSINSQTRAAALTRLRCRQFAR